MPDPTLSPKNLCEKSLQNFWESLAQYFSVFAVITIKTTAFHHHQNDGLLEPSLHYLAKSKLQA